MAKIPLPHIQGGSPAEQIAQMRSYLYQLVGELQWVLETIEQGNTVLTSPNGNRFTLSVDDSGNISVRPL